MVDTQLTSYIGLLFFSDGNRTKACANKSVQLVSCVLAALKVSKRKIVPPRSSYDSIFRGKMARDELLKLALIMYKRDLQAERPLGIQMIAKRAEAANVA